MSDVYSRYEQCRQAVILPTCERLGISPASAMEKIRKARRYSSGIPFQQLTAAPPGSPDLKTLALYAEHTWLTYFVMAPSTGVVKIGQTQELDKRLTSLRACSPVPLEVVALVEYDQRLERRTHQYLDKHRSHYEWFHLTDEVVSVIEAANDSARALVDMVGDAGPIFLSQLGLATDADFGVDSHCNLMV